MNKLELAGRLSKDPEIIEKDGKIVANISIASGRPYKDSEGKDVTDFIPVTMFGERAKQMKDLHKGDGISILGSLENNNYEKDGKTIYKNQVVGTKIVEITGKDKITDKNHITLEGNLTKKPKVTKTEEGKEVANVTVAVDRFGIDKADYITVPFWDDEAHEVADKFEKGNEHVSLTGRLNSKLGLMEKNLDAKPLEKKVAKEEAKTEPEVEAPATAEPVKETAKDIEPEM